MVLNVVGSNPIGHPRKSLATFRCEGFFVWYWLYYARPSIAMKQRRRSYSFNTAEKLNTLLLRMIRRMGLIKVGSHVDLDFDHQFIPAYKFDAKYSYKQDFGYFLGWASIGGIIVGGENCVGNTNVRFHQEDTLHRIMDCVTSELGVVIERFRADCGSFSKEII